MSLLQELHDDYMRIPEGIRVLLDAYLNKHPETHLGEVIYSETNWNKFKEEMGVVDSKIKGE